VINTEVVAWEILYSEPFEEWWDDLTEPQQDALTARIELLKARPQPRPPDG
jgi:hypothetical protein